MKTKRSFPAIIYILILLLFFALFYLLIEGFDFKVSPERGDMVSHKIINSPQNKLNYDFEKEEALENIAVYVINREHGVLLPGIFALLAAFVAFLGVSLTAFLTSKNNNKNIFINVVTSERAKWREDLRRDASKFYSLAYEHSENEKINNTIKLQELKTLIKLKLNPDPTHKLDNSIIRTVDSIVECITNESKDKEIREQLSRLESNVQKLLKQEWEKSKKEAQEGNVRKSI